MLVIYYLFSLLNEEVCFALELQYRPGNMTGQELLATSGLVLIVPRIPFVPLVWSTPRGRSISDQPRRASQPDSKMAGWLSLDMVVSFLVLLLLLLAMFEPRHSKKTQIVDQRFITPR